MRYWAASARLGTDTAFDDKIFKIGRRLVTKLFNAGKFVLAQTLNAPGEKYAISHELDLAFVAELRTLVERVSATFRQFEFAHALQHTEQFFWTRFTDTYLELAKFRARGEVGDAAGHVSAVATLRLGLDVLLRLFAPVLPYITEEVWSWAFAEETGQPTIHRASWPSVQEFAGIGLPAYPESLQAAIDALATLHKAKTDRGGSAGRPVDKLELLIGGASAAHLQAVLVDVLASARVREWRIIESPTPGLTVGELVLAQKVEG